MITTVLWRELFFSSPLKTPPSAADTAAPAPYLSIVRRSTRFAMHPSLSKASLRIGLARPGRRTIVKLTARILWDRPCQFSRSTTQQTKSSLGDLARQIGDRRHGSGSGIA